MWAVYGHALAAVVVVLVHGCLSRPMVDLFGVGSLELQRALARSEIVVVAPVSVLVSNVPVALGRHGTLDCVPPPHRGEKKEKKAEK